MTRPTIAPSSGLLSRLSLMANRQAPNKARLTVISVQRPKAIEIFLGVELLELE